MFIIWKFYIGSQKGQERMQNQGERVVFDLVRDVQGLGRNVTYDNFLPDLVCGKSYLKNTWLC